MLFVVTLNSSWQYACTTALVIFLIAGLTDFIDGEIARRYGVITNFGQLMDPLVDKIMMAAAFISLVPLKASAGVGCHDCRRARFSNYGLAPDGQCQGPDPAGGTAGETENFVADYYDRFLSGAPFDGANCDTSVRNRHGGARWTEAGPAFSVDYRGADDLLALASPGETASYLHRTNSGQRESKRLNRRKF